MIIAFPVILGIESIVPSPTFFANVWHMSGMFWSNPLVWMTMFFCCMQVSIGEILYRFLGDEEKTIERQKYVKLQLREQVFENKDEIVTEGHIQL
jgi:hypothetical protein